MSAVIFIAKKIFSTCLWIICIVKKVLLAVVPNSITRRFRGNSTPVLPVVSPALTKQSGGKLYEVPPVLERWDKPWGEELDTSNVSQEPDFFKDMQPHVKRAPKILRKSRQGLEDCTTSLNPEKFSMQATSDLGIFDEDAQNAWMD